MMDVLEYLPSCFSSILGCLALSTTCSFLRGLDGLPSSFLSLSSLLFFSFSSLSLRFNFFSLSLTRLRLSLSFLSRSFFARTEKYVKVCESGQHRLRFLWIIRSRWNCTSEFWILGVLELWIGDKFQCSSALKWEFKWLPKKISNFPKQQQQQKKVSILKSNPFSNPISKYECKSNRFAPISRRWWAIYALDN